MSPEVKEAAARHRELVDELRRARESRRGLGAIRVQYEVPAYLDAPVRFLGELGIIVGVSGPHLMIRLEDGSYQGPIHPTDTELVYLVGAGTVWNLERHGFGTQALDTPDGIQVFGILHNFLAAVAGAGGGVASW